MDKKKEVRTKILFAAHELFMNYGYRDTSLRMIGQRSGISHTQVIYHFKSKSYLGGLIINKYFAALFETMVALAQKNKNTTPKDYKLYWWSLHYLIVTTYKRFGKFHIEFISDESDTFVRIANKMVPSLYQDLFQLDINLKDNSFLVDSYIITSVDTTLTRLCIEKSLKVREGIKKLLSLDVLQDFRVVLSENEIEDFILDHQLLETVDQFKAEQIL